MQRICVSVPGKMIISGEHSVLQNYPIISMAINQRMNVLIKKNKTKSIVITSDLFGVCSFKLDKKTSPKKWCKSIFFLCKKLSNVGLEIKIDSKILNYGFGSSGAVFASICCGLLLLNNKNLSTTELLKQTLLLYFEFNKKQQFVGSGIDIITSILGGVVYYNRSTNILSKLDIDFFNNIHMYAVNTGYKADTKEAVNIARSVNNYQSILNRIGKITDKILLAIVNNKKHNFFNLIKENQDQLNKLSIVDKKINEILSFCKKQNIPAKISGSGLGDCVLVFGKNFQSDKYIYVNIKVDKNGLVYKFINNHDE